jgi:hypothetical protein
MTLSARTIIECGLLIPRALAGAVEATMTSTFNSEFRCQLRKPLEFPVSRAVLDEYVLALDVVQLTQARAQSLQPVARGIGGARVEVANRGKLRRTLSEGDAAMSTRLRVR